VALVSRPKAGQCLLLLERPLNSCSVVVYEVELRQMGGVMVGSELRRVRCVILIFVGIQQTMAVEQSPYHRIVVMVKV